MTRARVAGRRPVARTVGMLGLAGSVLASAPHAAHALTPGWVSVEALTGATRFDTHLSDYAWNVDPRMGLGAQAVAGIGPWGAGLRVWQARTAQHIDSADTPDPTVRSTSVDLVARMRLFGFAGIGLDACASVGRRHLGYAPDHVTVTTSGGDIPVALSPVDTWDGGGGLALRRAVAGPWTAGFDVETQFMSMDTAHRSGGAVITKRERFQEWNARLGLARTFGGR